MTIPTDEELSEAQQARLGLQALGVGEPVDSDDHLLYTAARLAEAAIALPSDLRAEAVALARHCLDRVRIEG